MSSTVTSQDLTERRRIEQDLHDGPQQTLIALLMTVRAVEARLRDGRDASSTASLAAGLAQRALVELRAVSRGAYPSLLSTEGLSAALETLRVGSGPVIDVRVALPEPPAAIVQTTIYFVCSEAVANARKHSGARALAISVDADGNTVRVEVRDDGIGGARAGSSGLRGLCNRVAALGGFLSVESPPGEGTSVVATLPAHPADA